jgi:hypothetical protein
MTADGVLADTVLVDTVLADTVLADTLLAERYRLIEPVGHGGMGQVWRGEDVRLGRPVAVKLIISVRGDAAGAADEVWREARDSARLVHPNVVGVYDVGVDRGRLFIVMEWVAGHDLATVLRRHGPFPAAQVAWIGSQTARALAAAHAAGLVHRDVKPANLLLTRTDAPRSDPPGDGVVKLADFGIAVPADPGTADAGRIEPGPLIGTSAYISPEQVMGRPAGPASDMYALGCALYELLIGRPPFTGHDPVQVMRRHLAHEPAPPSRLRPGVPSRLERLIMRLLTKDAAGRPADARKIARTLDSIARHAPADGEHVAVEHAAGRPVPTSHLTRPHRPPAAPGDEAAPAEEEAAPVEWAAPEMQAPPPAGRPKRVSRRSTAALAVAAAVTVAAALVFAASAGSLDGHAPPPAEHPVPAAKPTPSMHPVSRRPPPDATVGSVRKTKPKRERPGRAGDNGPGKAKDKDKDKTGGKGTGKGDGHGQG